ncbi:hypothetical protein Pmani_031949 [Petrolisthes manimaculis]|uniref:Uncharacterized protein n=1 Tax=Petrolisthes manimaculis TaxID=1843537 RepID=A0AAE1NUN7_9EUCA|nr:hypothetical protein Pmani_031949 [Petrolisthes manimaculis]
MNSEVFSLPHDLPTPLHSTPHTRHEAGGRGRQVEEDGRVVVEEKWMRKLYVVEERWRKLNGEGEVEEVIDGGVGEVEETRKWSRGGGSWVEEK